MEVESLILYLILIVFILLVLTLFLFFWYCGLFAQLDIKTCKPPFKSIEVAYKFAKGSYSDSGTYFKEAHSIAPDLRCIGVYYDNVPNIHVNELRYMIGLILNDEGKVVDDETRNLIQSKGFQFATFPEVEHVVYSSFPHKSSASVVIAVNRLIPAFRQYIKDHDLQAYPLIEICDGLEIVYVAPLSKQEEFFVPEALVESEEPLSEEQTVEEVEESSVKDAEELQPDTASSVDSLAEGQSREAPSLEIIDSLEENHKNGMTNGSEASTESFEELQLDS